MPIYEYECRECGHVFDALQKMSDAPLTDCPDCGEPKLRKLLSAPNFRLKGGGWYETDFKDRNKRNLAGGDKPATSGDGDASPAAASKVSGKEGSNEASKTEAAKTEPVKPSAAKSNTAAAARNKSAD